MSRRVPIQVMPGCRDRVAVPALRRVARTVLSAEDVAPSVEVDIVLADGPTIRDLNRLYRGKDEQTDVLSFAALDGEAFVGAPDETPSLGEIVVCLPVAEAQAQAAQRGVEGEVAHLIVHGLLHLLGYDHEDSEDESQRMKDREDALLASLGYEGAYEHGH